MSELIWYENKMTYNNAPAPFVASSSGGLTGAFNFFDGKKEPYLRISNTEWIQITLDKAIEVNCIKYDSHPVIENNATGFVLYGSDDGVNFNKITEESGIDWTENETKIFKFENKEYKIFRFSFTTPLNLHYLSEVTFGLEIPTRRLAIKNPTTNQYYSLSEKTLITLPDSSSKNMILHGIEAGKEIQLDEAFNKIHYVSENLSETKGKVFTQKLAAAPNKLWIKEVK